MGISFEDSLKQMAAATPAVTTETPSVMTVSELNTPVAAYSEDDGDWETLSNYAHYRVFSDENMSVIDEGKNISLDGKQFNITQEENSQYIPFMMPRFYDGFDLAGMSNNTENGTTISIHYETSDGNHGVSFPVNVEYNNSHIKFGWLVDGGVTRAPGKLKFEIHVVGTALKAGGQAQDAIPYVWKTKINDTLNVSQSLCSADCNGTIHIDDTWVSELVTRVAESVAQQIAGVQVGAQVQAAEDAAARAEAAATSATTSANNASQAAENKVNAILDNYPTKEELQQAVESVDVSEALGNLGTNEDGSTRTVVQYVDSSVQEVSDALDIAVQTINKDLEDNYYTTSESDAKLAVTLSEGGYATKTDVAEAIAAEDITAKLGNYYTKAEIGNYGEVESVIAYVDQAIEDVDVSEQLGNLGQNEDGSNRTVVQYIENKLDNVDLTNYVTTSAHSSDVGKINSAIETINTTLGQIDKSPRKTYEATYGNVELEDGTTQEYMFTLWEKSGDEDPAPTVKSRFQIMGGGGGSGNSVSLVISYVEGYKSPLAVTVDDRAILKYNFSGEDSAGDTDLDGTASWKVGNRVVATQEVATGECEFDLTDYVTVGDNKILLTITHATGAIATKSWTIKVVDVRLTSNFDDKKKYDANKPITFSFTPYGHVNKTVHFILDGEEIGTQASSASAAGLSASFTIPAQSHGSHLLKVYMTADDMTTSVNGEPEPVKSNFIIKDIICYDDMATEAVIGTTFQEFEARQYDTTNITYTVFDPTTETPEVNIAVDGIVVSTQTLTSSTTTYPFKTDVIGDHTITITCGTVTKTLIAHVSKLDITVSPVTAGLAFDFNPVGKSNDAVDRLWSYEDINMTVSDNFDWVNGGYQLDDNGDQYFCIKAGTQAVIHYNLFADDPKKDGKEFKIIFRTRNIRRRDTSFLTCLDAGIGLDMKVEYSTLYETGGFLKTDYCEDEIIEYELNINKDADMRIVMSYEDGTPSKPYEYKETSSFKQANPQPITLGSADCDILIYRIKAYSNSLTDIDIMNNFIADARNATDMIGRYERNQIYNKNNELVATLNDGFFNADDLMKAAPDLRYVFLEVPRFTWDKDIKIDDCTVYFRYPNGTRPHDNWKCTGVRHRGQGTSSNLYGYAGRNIDLCMDRDESLFTYTDENGNEVTSSTITLTDTSVPTDYLNIKVKIFAPIYGDIYSVA